MLSASFVSNVTAVAAAIIAVSGAVAVIYRIPWVNRQWLLHREAQSAARVSDMRRAVAPLVHEMFPNSGLSMRDAVDRIERRQLENSVRIGALTTRVDELCEDLGCETG